eukprot:TRINITY_DN77284_c0_g1_i1.p1 TRINITY_DN77284_c0_g1~~TRINITY_DN77284_c0_g1_i1.p1  ORF type:complete len:224 (+),score=45.26 TRINITY_DN77284_c0_g1_i1:129-800(+)
MFSKLAGRWKIQTEEETIYAVVTDGGRVSFLGDPNTSLRFVEGHAEGNFLLKSDDGEEIANAVLTQQNDTTQDDHTDVLMVDCQDGHETWRKVDVEASSPKAVSRKPGAIIRRYTKEAVEGQQASSDSAAEAAKEAPEHKNESRPSNAEMLKTFCAKNAVGTVALDSFQVKQLLHLGPHRFTDEEMSMLFRRLDKTNGGTVTFESVVDFAYGKTDLPEQACMQ